MLRNSQTQFFFLLKNIFLAILVFSYSFHVQSKTSVGGNAGENGTVRPKAQSSGSQTQGAALSVGKQEYGTDTAPQPGRESSPVAHSHQGHGLKNEDCHSTTSKGLLQPYQSILILQIPGIHL